MLLNISIKSLTPEPLVDYFKNNTYRSDIWQQEFELLPKKKYLVSAQSGKGKSTFTHILYGLRKDYLGEVYIGDSILGNKENNLQNIKSFSQEIYGTLRQTKMSIVFQDLRLFPNLTALENILLKNELTNTFTLSQIQDLAQKMNITHTLNRKTETLSYGERQRTAIIRALAQPFELLLLDEPFSHLDRANIEIVQNIILDFVQKNNATMMITTLGEDYNIAYDKILRL